jgi:hypothetical protein
MSSQPKSAFVLLRGLMTARQVNRKSRAVSGAPSAQVTPRRQCSVIVRESREMPPLP